MNKYVLGIIFALGVSFAYAATKEQPKKNELVCDKKETVKNTMIGAKFFPLLNMTNKEGVVETIWISGSTIAITASPAKEDVSCMLAMMSDVIYDSDTITALHKVFEQQLNKEKGI